MDGRSRGGLVLIRNWGPRTIPRGAHTVIANNKNTSGAKARVRTEGLNAALEALLHPNPSRLRFGLCSECRGPSSGVARQRATPLPQDDKEKGVFRGQECARHTNPAELRSAWTLRLRSGQALGGGCLHADTAGSKSNSRSLDCARDDTGEGGFRAKTGGDARPASSTGEGTVKMESVFWPHS
jgi:hypothetical protein